MRHHEAAQVVPEGPGGAVRHHVMIRINVCQQMGHVENMQCTHVVYV